MNEKTVESRLSAKRIALFEETYQDLCFSLKKIGCPKDFTDDLRVAYKKIDDAFEFAIHEEAKYLASLS